MIQKAMVMAAGVGSRLDPLTQCIPKPLVPILNRPVMDILLEKLAHCGIKEVVANTYYLAEKIEERYSKSCPVNISFVHEKELSGTAGGLKKCELFFDNCENLLVVSADGFHDADLGRIIAAHEESGCIATMAVVPVDIEDVSNYGVVVTNKDFSVSEFQEKPPVSEAKSNCINTGIYVFNKRIFDYIPANRIYDFARDVFPALLNAGEKINTYKIYNYWSDIGTLEQYLQSNKDALMRKVMVSGVDIINKYNAKYVVGEHTVLPENVKIYDACIIGSNCKIGENATLRNVILWDGVEVAEGITLENVVVANNTVIEMSLKNEIVGADRIIGKKVKALV